MKLEIDTEVLARLGAYYAPFVLRVSLALVFLYFGISQLAHPETFVGWLPKEVSMIPISPRTFVALNGGFETFFALMLMLGIIPRLSALLLGGHLLGITLTIGFTEIGVRDFGLAIATLVIVLTGAGPLRYDSLFGSSDDNYVDPIAPLLEKK